MYRNLFRYTKSKSEVSYKSIRHKTLKPKFKPSSDFKTTFWTFECVWLGIHKGYFTKTGKKC